MLHWLHFYVRLCFLKEVPQDAPYSKSLLYTGIFAFYCVGVAFTSLSQAFIVGLIMPILQIALLIFLTNLILWIRKTPERYEQTITALSFCGAIIGVITVVILSYVVSLGDSGESIMTVLGSILILWVTVVFGHIFYHAMEVTFFGGLGVSMIYMYLSFAVILRLMKIIAAPF